MKELSIEEKAKAYDEALKKAKDMLSYKEVRREDMEYLFPELKIEESEDERIRQLLIRFVTYDMSDNYSDDFTPADCVAWLEKQGKNNMGISEATKQKLEDNLNKALEKETPESWNEFLEKQGEQKYIPKYKIGDYVKDTNYKGEPIYEIVYMDKECYICEYRGKERMGDKAVMHFSFDNPYLRLVQKPADKVEPKFKVGDTIYYNSFGELKSMIVANVVTDSTDNPMYEDKEGNAVFEKDLVEQKPAWSEEDEAKLKSILFHIEDVENKDVIDWLKSLKDRVQPQPKQEWNEDTQQWIDSIIKDYEERYDVDKDHRATIQTKINILKSLRPQSAWKPSDGQMKLLREVQQALLGKDCHNRFVNFMYELKRLREE